MGGWAGGEFFPQVGVCRDADGKATSSVKPDEEVCANEGGGGDDAGDAGDTAEDDAQGDEVVGEDTAGRAIRGARVPLEPTKAMRDEHNRPHWPRRPWCRHCAASSSVASPHRSGDSADSCSL